MRETAPLMEPHCAPALRVARKRPAGAESIYKSKTTTKSGKCCRLSKSDLVASSLRLPAPSGYALSAGPTPFAKERRSWSLTALRRCARRGSALRARSLSGRAKAKQERQQRANARRPSAERCRAARATNFELQRPRLIARARREAAAGFRKLVWCRRRFVYPRHRATP